MGEKRDVKLALSAAKTGQSGPKNICWRTAPGAENAEAGQKNLEGEGSQQAKRY